MKATLRRQLRKKRRSLSISDHARRSELAAVVVGRLASFKAGARIAVYLPFDRETDTAELLRIARRRGVRVYVPVVSDRRHRRLKFFPLTGRTRRGVFGIAVPQTMSTPVASRWFNLMVVPLVGVDTAGRRLGMGGGFYDRALEFRQGRRFWLGPKLVGFAFDCQHVADVHAEPWDLQLDMLASESGLHHFAKTRQ